MLQAEELGLLPTQLALLVLCFLPKQDGSHRPIGLFMAGIRVWGRVRRATVAAWEGQHDRSYLGGVAGTSTEAVVWHQLLAKEYAMATDKCMAAMLVDLKKAIEFVCHVLLIRNCKDIGFPMQIAGWCILL